MCVLGGCDTFVSLLSTKEESQCQSYFEESLPVKKRPAASSNHSNTIQIDEKANTIVSIPASMKPALAGARFAVDNIVNGLKRNIREQKEKSEKVYIIMLCI